MKQIKSYADACKALKIATKLPVITGASVADRKAMIALHKLSIIVKALNEGWKPNWEDSNQYKYYPYFDMRRGGFSYVDCNYWDTLTTVDSRLCYKSSEVAMYAGKTFFPLYKDLMTLK